MIIELQAPLPVEENEFVIGTKTVGDAVVLDVEMMSKVILHAQHLDLYQKRILLNRLLADVCIIVRVKIS